MRKGIHPDYQQATVICNCGNTFLEEVQQSQNFMLKFVQHAHPFYTGQQKAISARGRIDKFNKKSWYQIILKDNRLRRILNLFSYLQRVFLLRKIRYIYENKERLGSSGIGGQA